MSNVQWLWLDANVFNNENTIFLESIKLFGTKIKPFKCYATFAEELNKIE